MLQIRTAKLFKNGSSQAVRLPAEFRFSGDEVYVTRNEATGDVMLSDRPGKQIWGDFFDLTHSLDVSIDFMTDRPMNVPCQTSGVFDDVTMPIDERKT